MSSYFWDTTLAIVAAAGNTGYDPLNQQVIYEYGTGYKYGRNKHHYGEFASGSDSLEIVVAADNGESYEFDDLEIFYLASQSCSVTVVSPGNQCCIGPLGPGEGTGQPSQGSLTDCGLISIHNEHWGTGAYAEPYPNSTDNCIRVHIQDKDTYNEQAGTWKIRLKNIIGRWDGYLASQKHDIAGHVSYLPIWTNDNTIQEPSTANNVIAVGSFNSKNAWVNWRGDSIPAATTRLKFQAAGYPLNFVSFFSSQGPTRDGRDKPEIYAPGAWIASSYAPFSYELPYNPWKMAGDSDYIHSWGTSFAAPHVTGTIALMLEKNDTLSYRSIKDILIKSSTVKYLNTYRAVSATIGDGGGRGDVNLNGVREIGDYIVFTNYFIKGTAAFFINLEAQIAASDVNGDGNALEVSDYVYLIRIITGDALPPAKPTPGMMAEFNSDGTSVRVKTPVDIGATLFVFKGEVCPALGSAASGMEVTYGHINGTTRVLVHSIERGRAITNGEVLKLSGQGTLISVEAATYGGGVLSTNMNSQSPKDYKLSQNYPNPFNSTTTIKLALPIASNWTFSVYNLAGQKVFETSGYSEASIHQVEWNAETQASGIYFYKVDAGKFSATKKMALMK